MTLICPEAFRVRVRQRDVDLPTLQGDLVSGVIHANHKAFCCPSHGASPVKEALNLVLAAPNARGLVQA
jgi:hypothetical protein